MSIDLQIANGVAIVTMNRPEVHNALDSEHYTALSNTWRTVRDDPEIRVAILTGAGDRAFSAGADIKTFLTRKSQWSDVWQTQRDQLLNRGLEIWKPVIAAVNGFCVGGGMTMLASALGHVQLSEAGRFRWTAGGVGGTEAQAS